LAVVAFGGVIVLPVYAQNVYAQGQTPTQPQPTPNLGTLRGRLQQGLGSRTGTQQGAAQPGAMPGLGASSLRDRLGKKATEAQKPGLKGLKPGEALKPGQPPEGEKAPPQPRGKEPAKPTKPGAPAAKPAAPAAKGPPAGGGGVSAVRTVGKGTYDPIKNRTIEYGEVPDTGEVMTLNGPIATKDFLDTLVLATNWNVLVTELAQKTNLAFWISEMKPKEALEVLKFHDIYYDYNPDTKYLYVMTKQEYLDRKFGNQEEHEFVVKHASVDYIESVLSSLMSEKARIMTDPRTQHILVWDTRDNLDKMEETVKEFDVPLSEKAFTVKHADIADLETVLTGLLSQAGNMVSDARTGTILVKDLPDNIEKMQVAMNQLDVPLESQVFPIININADTLTDSVQSLMTERGKVQVDPHSNAIIVTDVPSRQDQIATLVDTLDKKLETRTWTLNYVEPDAISERIESLVPQEMGNVITDEDVHQVTVTAFPERLDEIDDLIKTWDVKRKQVQIEAYLVTVSTDLQRQLNINWSYFDSSGNNPMELRVNNGAAPDYTKPSTDQFRIGQLPYATPLRNPFTGAVIKDIQGKPIIQALRGNHVAAMLDYLDKHGDVTVLSAPRVTVQDGEEAVFQSGSQIPYVSSTSYGYGNYNPYATPITTPGTTPGTTTGTTTASSYYNYGSQPYNRIEFMEVGTILNVMPRITEDGSILLDIAAEDSSADISNKVISNGQENTIPLKKQSRAETQLRAESGQTLVIGGLRTGNSSKTVSKSVPIISDIPLIGRLFKNPSKSVRTESLMIFITPTIVGEKTQPEAEQVAMVDDEIARAVRKAEKTSFGRFADNLSGGKNDIVVAVGQSGAIRCDGKKMTLDDLRNRFNAVKAPLTAVVVLRKHPRAPQDVLTSITDMALEKDLRVVLDTLSPAFVPDYSAAEEKAGPQNPQDEIKPPENAPAPPAPESDKPAEDVPK
jgi:type II secretory pathway component GspD/PulD (secretin)